VRRTIDDQLGEIGKARLPGRAWRPESIPAAHGYADEVQQQKP
jgi:hypothetical protein